MQSVVIVDTGCANLASVNYAIKPLLDSVSSLTISDQPAVIEAADRVILPGVGSAINAMRAINQKQLAPVLANLTVPVLGICLGMQLLLEVSEENVWGSIETVPCLGRIPGAVKRMQTGALRLPHMGWNQIEHQGHPLFAGVANLSYFYFVHSFAVPISEYTLATCDYGQAFSAVIAKNNYLGVQFHPERSGATGRQLLQNFIRLSAAELCTLSTNEQ